MTQQSLSFDIASKNSEPLQLLIVDDDDIDRERVRRILAKLHIPSIVTEADSLIAARECLGQQDFDCVFLDYQMGGELGTELLHDIKSGVLSYVPVVMVTGSASERLVVEAMQQGAHDFIFKTQLQVGLVETVLVNSQLRASLEREIRVKRERLEYLSFYDVLTGLPNRALFFDRLEQCCQSAARNEQGFAVLQIDLDLFKAVNDNHGHAVGDVVLATVAQRIKATLRGVDTVARLGGDEFAAVLVNIPSEEAALSVAEKIASEVRKTISVDNLLLSIEASIGISIYPEQGEDIHSLLLKADWAMYAAKHSGSMYMVYTGGMESMRQRPSQEVGALKHAIEQNEFFMEYQPILDLRTQQINGVEALVRWRKPSGDLVLPGVFIPQAEKSLIIQQLTYATIDMTLDQLRCWHFAGLRLPVSLNLSARMLESAELPKRLLAALTARGLPPSLLTLELTETALMSNVEQAQGILNSLTARGVRISIDDFGAGFTSFKYLRQLEVAEIKVDMAFTADMSPESRDKVIVQSITVLASGFGIPVVAEGIEDIASCEVLREIGCQFGQGYAIAKPMAGDAVASWVQQWRAARASAMC